MLLLFHKIPLKKDARDLGYPWNLRQKEQQVKFLVGITVLH